MKLKINLAYNLASIMELRSERKKLLDRKKNILRSQSGEDYSQLEQEIQKIDDEIESEKREMFYSQKSFSGVAFVSFRYEMHKRKVLSHGKMSVWTHIVNLMTGLMLEEGLVLELEGGGEVKIMQAPEPNDVNWESIYDWAHNSKIRRILGTLAAVVISIMFIYIIYYLIRLQA